ncbi:MAG: PASTA domain-containing protein, partial [Candidatus Nanopelagicales bacterium]
TAPVPATGPVARAVPPPPSGAAAGPEAGRAEPAEALPLELTRDPRYERAEQAYRLGDWDEAVTLFESVHAAHPGVEIPHLESARRKREISAWWARAELGERRTGTAAAVPVGPAPPEAPVHEGGAPGTPPPERLGAVGPADLQPKPDHPGPPGKRRTSAVIATVVLLLVLGIAAAWLLTPGGGGDVTTDGGPTEANVPEDSTSSTAPTSPSPVTRAAPNLTAYTLEGQAAEVPLNGEAEFEVRVWNQPSDDREVGTATGGVLTVAAAGPGIEIAAGRPTCVDPEDGSIRCEFGRLGKDETASFWVTLRGTALGTSELETRVEQGDGQEGRGATREFTVVEQPCVVPDVRGLTREQAEENLRAAGLVPVAVGVEDGAASGLVIEQSPGPGERLGCGTEVEFKYSTLT